MAELTPERWREISALLDRLLAVEPAERASWLEQEIGDEQLRAELAELAANAERTGGVLDGPAGERLEALVAGAGLTGETPEEAAGRRIGPYRIVREVGRGGMGIVYLADRADGQFEHQVALKLVKPGLDGRGIVRRFERERHIVARLEHPAIARILDGGVTDNDRPYFAMEFVDGVPVTEYCDRERLSIEQRLQLFSRICEAVQYAHGRLVVHRDLKPSNILVDAGGELKLVDFGIAKVLSDEDEAPDITRAGGERPLTPAYAAPEQLAGESVTTATDVYTLGLVLYELLVGRHPFKSETGSTREIEHAILKTDPVAPSRAAVKTAVRESGAAAPSPSDRAGVRGLSTTALARRLAGDLDAIVLTALRKRAAHRYPSAEALRKDIESHLAHRPIQARRAGMAARARKFVRRHRLGVAATALLMLSIAAGFAGTAWQARQKAREANKARQVTEFLTGLFEAADPAQAQGDEITARELVEQGATRLEHELADQPELQAEMDLVLGRINYKLGLSEEALTLLDRSLDRLPNVDRPAALRTHANALRTKGAVLVQLGRAEEAEPLLRAAVAKHEKLPRRGFDRELEIAEDLDELTIALGALGRPADQEATARRAFELRLPVLGPDHTGIASSYNNLAVIQRQLGKFDEAEGNYKKALEIRVPTLGKVHPDTADTLNNLAALYYHTGRYAAAEQQFSQVREIYGRLYGDSHPRTIGGTNNLAVVLLKLGELERAERYLDSVLAHWRQTAGEQHPNALMTRSNLSLLYQVRGESRRAEAAANAVHTAAGEILGPTHPVTAVFALRLASTLRELGYPEQAREQAIPAHSVLEKVYGAEHQQVAGGLEELGRIDADLGELVQAEERLRRAVAIRSAQLGDEAFETLTARTALAAVLRANGALEESERLLSADLAAGRRVLPDNHPILCDLLLQLGQTLTAAGRTGEAEPLIREALAAAGERYGKRNWRTAKAELRLAELLDATGRAHEAEKLAAAAQTVIADQLGSDHPLARAAGELGR